MGWGIKASGTLFLLCLLTACGNTKGDYTTAFPEDFFAKNKSAIISDFDTFYNRGHFQWIIHVNFRGNDAGFGDGTETTSILVPPDQVDQFQATKHSPFAEFSLPPDAEALSAKFDYASPRVLGSLYYRFDSRERAVQAFETLFSCQDGSSDSLSKTLVFGSGGSHGGKELENFALLLQKNCGKKLDLAVVGDGIAKPAHNPMGTFNGLQSDGVCLQFWQANSPLVVLYNGARLQPCANVHVLMADHVTLAAYAPEFVKGLLDLLQ